MSNSLSSTINNQLLQWREQVNFLNLMPVIKLIGAGMLALWLSFLFDLEQPRTALITVTIVMQTHSGMVLSKSYYRLLGTLVGIVISLLLVGLFAQEPILFLFSMALWIGLCTAGSLILKDHQSYAFVLAGYTLCIVGLPATLNPDNSFDIAMNRVSEILIGLICATLVSELVLPKRMGDVIFKTLRQRFIDFTHIVNAAYSLQGHNKNTLVTLANDVFRIESFQASTTLESNASRSLRLKLTHLNMTFMAASTTLHTFTELLQRIRKNHLQSTYLALQDAFKYLTESLLLNHHPARDEEEAKNILSQLNLLENKFDTLATTQKNNTSINQLEFATGLLLLHRLTDEIRAYINQYVTLHDVKPNATLPPIGIHFEPMAALLAGVRGALVLVITASIWISTAWQSGIEAITFAVVGTTLFASTPAPKKTAHHFLIGALIGGVLGYITNFLVLTRADGFFMLVLALLPGLLIASTLTSRANTAIIGAGVFIVFLSHLGFSRTFENHQEGFVNDVIADYVGIICAIVMYQLIDLHSNSWLQQRTVRALHKLVIACCREPLSLRREKLELGSRELIMRSGISHRLLTADDELTAQWFFVCLEVGHTVIHLRETQQSNDTQAQQRALNELIKALTDLFNSPSKGRFKECILLIDSLMSYINNVHTTTNHSIALNLQVLKHSLMDNRTLFLTFAKNRR